MNRKKTLLVLLIVLQSYMTGLFAAEDTDWPTDWSLVSSSGDIQSDNEEFGEVFQEEGSVSSLSFCDNSWFDQKLQDNPQMGQKERKISEEDTTKKLREALKVIPRADQVAEAHCIVAKVFTPKRKPRDGGCTTDQIGNTFLRGRVSSDPDSCTDVLDSLGAGFDEFLGEVGQAISALPTVLLGLLYDLVDDDENSTDD